MSTAFATAAPLCGLKCHTSTLYGASPSRTASYSGRSARRRPPRASADAAGSALATSKVAVENAGGSISSLLDLCWKGDGKATGVIIGESADTVLETTELATIPEGLLLTPRAARALLIDAWPGAKQTLTTLPDEAVLALAVLYERRRDASTFAPLLAQLPDAVQVHAASAWRDAELDWLLGSPVLTAARRVREGMRDEWRRVAEALSASGVAVGKEEGLDEAWYAWAVSVIDTSAIRVSEEEPLVLAPVTLWCGCAPIWEPASANVEMSGGFFFSKRRLVLKAARNLAPEDTITLQAESASNADLLLERGDARSDSRAYAVEIEFEMATLDRFFEDKELILSRVDLDARQTFLLTAPDARGLWKPPENLDAFLRLICLTGADAFLLEPVFNADVWDFMQLPISADNEAAACQLIIGACEDALDAYVSDLDGDTPDDQQIIDDASLVRWRLAKTVVAGEKLVLQTAKAHYERVAQSLDVLEYYAERRLKDLDLLRPLDESEIIESESGDRVGRAFDENFR